MMKVLAAAVLLLQTASQQPYIETFEVRLHNLDVVVTDRAGKPVSGLTKDDFVVTENGAAQEITNFAVYGESAGSAATPHPGQAGLPVLHTPRKFIFFIDEMSLHPQTRSRLLKNATAMLEKSMSEGDQAAIVRPYGETNIVLNYTGDIDEFVRAFGAVLAENGTRINTQQSAEIRFLELQLADTADDSLSQRERKFVRRMYADAVRRRTEQRLGQLRALVSSFAGTEGKKIVVLVTTSLSALPGWEARDSEDLEIGAASDADVPSALPIYVDLKPKIEELGRTAAANGVTMYTLQPDVPVEFSVPGRESPRPRLQTTSAGPIQAPRVRVVLPSNMGSVLIDNTQTTMKTLAEKTGGRSYLGDGNIDDTFRQIGTDLSSYYSLAYRAKGDSDKPRRVEVQVKGRPELRVRTRTDVIEKSAEREMEDLVVANLMYPRTTNELAVRAVPGTIRKSRNLVTIPVETQIPMERLTFLPGADGKYHASFTVHYAAAGEKMDFSAGQQRRQDVTLSAEEMLALAGKVFRYRSDLEVAPGHVKIAVGVLDRTSKLSGFAVISMWAK